ncbi:C-C motif chemokine 28 [Onychostruthus taczanowskii]|uniref:C-C motif chemokine 28 n=1 Tax=Onychostruthus taczanowskii TaxID=356909 RepID=UPI001B80DA56|nr:C-C motif chemokine 28 [Onychostruthus taczanowskii]
MDVKFVIVLVVLAVMVSQTSETLFPRAFSCCMKISDEISKGILRRVERFEIQKAGGLCHLEAVILHMKGRKFCVNPWNRKVEKMMKKMKHKIHRSKSHVRKQRRVRRTKQKEQKQ